MMIDTHQHLWNLEQFPYSWCAGIGKLNRSYLLRDYLDAAKGVGVTKTIFMECDVDEPHALDEARHIQSLAEQKPHDPPDPGAPRIAGIIAGGRPERGGFEQHLDELKRLPLVRGVRRVLHTQGDDVPRSPLFAENLRLLPKYGFTFDLCVTGRQLPIAIALAKQCPGVSFILDHCGSPDIKGGVYEPWRTHIKELAALPNLTCKISGMITSADFDHWKAADLRPAFDYLIDRFGWDRVVWGSDWPVCLLAGSYKRWADATMELISKATSGERDKLLWRNAERVYRV